MTCRTGLPESASIWWEMMLLAIEPEIHIAPM